MESLHKRPQYLNCVMLEVSTDIYSKTFKLFGIIYRLGNNGQIMYFLCMVSVDFYDYVC